MNQLNQSIRAAWPRAAGTAATIGAMAAAMALGASSPASATEFNYSVNYDASALRCGFFVTTVQCAEAVAITPITTAVGDQINIHVTSAQPIQVPGSRTENLFFVAAIDAHEANGIDGSGPVTNSYRLTPSNFTAPGAPPPLTGAGLADLTAAAGYKGILGYCCGYGEPNAGFSFTGVDASLTVTTADPFQTVAIAGGYIYNLASIPTSLSDLPGGTADSPLILPSGLIVGDIRGSISGGGPTEQFYRFDWAGGLFQTLGTITGADPGASFIFELRDSAGNLISTIPGLTLNGGDDFSQLLSVALARGQYEIGVRTDSPLDPAFDLEFLTPVGEAPEPATWAMMLLGFGALGAMARRRRTVLAAAA